MKPSKISIIHDKFLGCTLVPSRIKEWAFVGFGIDFISAIIACIAVYGLGQAWLAIIAMVVLIVAYVSYHRLLAAKAVKA